MGGLKGYPADLSPYLHLTAWVTQVRFEYFPSGLPGEGSRYKDVGFFARICDLRGGGVAYSHLKLTQMVTEEDEIHKELQLRSWDCIVLGKVNRRKEGVRFTHDADDKGRRGPLALLVTWKQDHFERVGDFEFAPVDFAWTPNEPLSMKPRNTSYSWRFSITKSTIRFG
jgi:hypothetical protein